MCSTTSRAPTRCNHLLRTLVYLVLHDYGQVSLEHLLLSWYPTLSILSSTTSVYHPVPGAREIHALRAQFHGMSDSDGHGGPVVRGGAVRCAQQQAGHPQGLPRRCKTRRPFGTWKEASGWRVDDGRNIYGLTRSASHKMHVQGYLAHKKPSPLRTLQ